MTKSEVRTVVLSRLALHADSVVWDIGAGTGSVSVECALAAYAGCVYAVEKNAAAVDLIEKNARRFKADNLIAVAGERRRRWRRFLRPRMSLSEAVRAICGKSLRFCCAEIRKCASCSALRRWRRRPRLFHARRNSVLYGLKRCRSARPVQKSLAGII